MKYSLYLLLLFCLMSFSSLATVLIVDNNLNSPANYTSLQAAIDAASTGDTIYIQGSPTTYGTITLNKGLTLIGAGYNARKEVSNPSTIYRLTIDTADGTGGSNSVIMGLNITDFLRNEVNYSEGFINDVIIKRNRVNTLDVGNAVDWLVVNNYIVNEIDRYVGTSSGLIISNNIFYDYYVFYDWDENGNTVYVSNNVFMNPSYSIYYHSVSNFIFVNNIFYGVSPYHASNTYCSWSNNMSYSSVNDNFYLEGTNEGGGNIVSTSPQFKETNSDELFSYSDNLDLKAASPAVGAGTDGKDLGIYGGSYPFPDKDAGTGNMYTGMPPIPQIINTNILNVALPKDSLLKVQINARIQE